MHFGAFKKHIGFYPTPSAIHKFQKKISAYEITKGSIKFPLNQPIPRDLIQEIIEFRISEFNTIH